MKPTTSQLAPSRTMLLDQEGKYLTFALGPEEYGLEILKVREIIGYMAITAVPRMPVYVKGVINLRGQVIPVVDIRMLFDMASKEITDQTCIIVVETVRNQRAVSTGIIVDKVCEVLDIAGENIEEAPAFGTAKTDFILGMGKVNNAVKILLEIDRILDCSLEIGESNGSEQVMNSVSGVTQCTKT